MTIRTNSELKSNVIALRAKGESWPDVAALLLEHGIQPEILLQVLLPMVDSYGGRWAIIRAAVIDVPESMNFILVREAIEAAGIDLKEAVGHMVDSGGDRKEAARRLGL